MQGGGRMGGGEVGRKGGWEAGGGLYLPIGLFEVHSYKSKKC